MDMMQWRSKFLGRPNSNRGCMYTRPSGRPQPQLGIEACLKWH